MLFLLGCGGLAAFSVLERALGLDRGRVGLVATVFFALFLVTAVALALASATFASVVGRFVAERTRRPGLLIAGRRLAAAPFHASRAGAVLLFGVLIGSMAQGVRVSILTSVAPSDGFYRSALDLVNVALAVGLLLASAGLLVEAVEGLVTRRRGLAALTAAGTPARVLRRAVLAESLLPLLPTSLLAALAGILAAHGVLGTSVTVSAGSTTRTVSVPVPWTALGVLVGGTLLLTALVTSVSLVFLRRSTSPSELRAAA